MDSPEMAFVECPCRGIVGCRACGGLAVLLVPSEEDSLAANAMFVDRRRWT